MLNNNKQIWTSFLALLVVISMVLSACSEPDAEVVEKEVTRVIKETVIETVTVQETVIVGGTPEIVEQIVTREVEVERVITPTPQSKMGGKLVYSLGAEPDTLDIHLSAEGVTDIVMASVGGQLITQDPYTGDFVPYLAESWDASEDGTTLTFVLKQGIKFHDGTPLTAQDYAWTFQRALDP